MAKKWCWCCNLVLGQRSKCLWLLWQVAGCQHGVSGQRAGFGCSRLLCAESTSTQSWTGGTGSVALLTGPVDLWPSTSLSCFWDTWRKYPLQCNVQVTTPHWEKKKTHTVLHGNKVPNFVSTKNENIFLHWSRSVSLFGCSQSCSSYSILKYLNT